MIECCEFLAINNLCRVVVMVSMESLGRNKLIGAGMLAAVAALPVAADAALPERNKYGLSGSLGVGLTTVSLPENDTYNRYYRYNRDPGKAREEVVADGMAIIAEGSINLGKLSIKGEYNTVERGGSAYADLTLYEGKSTELHAKIGIQQANILPHSKEPYTFGGVEFRKGVGVPGKGFAELYAGVNVQLDMKPGEPQIQQYEIGLKWSLPDDITIKFSFENERINSIPRAGTPANVVRDLNVDKFAEMKSTTISGSIRF